MKASPSSILFAAGSLGLLGAAADDVSSPSLGRGLAGLAQRWNISEPSFGYENKTLSLKWEISDYIQDKYMFYRLYDGEDCEDGTNQGTANDITEDMQDLVGGNAYLLPRFTVDSTTPFQTDDATSGNGIRDAYLHLEIQSQKIANSSIYRENDAIGAVTAEIRFCARFSLWNDYALLGQGVGLAGTSSGPNPSAVEVNYQETIIVSLHRVSEPLCVDCFTHNLFLHPSYSIDLER